MSVLRLLKKYPDQRPVIVNNTKKFLVHKDMTVAQFLHLLRRHLNEKEALFLFFEGQSVCVSDTISSVYDRYQRDDILYAETHIENVFGFT